MRDTSFDRLVGLPPLDFSSVRGPPRPYLRACSGSFPVPHHGAWTIQLPSWTRPSPFVSAIVRITPSNASRPRTRVLLPLSGPWVRYHYRTFSYSWTTEVVKGPRTSRGSADTCRVFSKRAMKPNPTYRVHLGQYTAHPLRGRILMDLWSRDL